MQKPNVGKQNEKHISCVLLFASVTLRPLVVSQNFEYQPGQKNHRHILVENLTSSKRLKFEDNTFHRREDMRGGSVEKSFAPVNV